jgi:hypothetical protein
MRNLRSAKTQMQPSTQYEISFEVLQPTQNTNIRGAFRVLFAEVRLITEMD